MLFMTTVLLASALLAAQGEELKETKATPFVVAVCDYDYSSGDPIAYQLKPLAAYVEGRWLPSEFFEITIFPKKDQAEISPFRPEQDTFLTGLLEKTFYLCADPQVTYLPQRKSVAWMIDRQYLGLSGQLKGTIVEDDEERGTFDEDGEDRVAAMTNIRGACGSMKSAKLSEAEDALLSNRAHEAIVASVNESMREYGDKKIDPQFDPSRYYAPKITRVLRCELPSGWTGLWVRAIMKYPLETSPESELSNNSEWSGYYSCLLQTKPKSTNPVLWEYADNLCSIYGNRKFDLQGIFDGDKDGVPEFAIYRHGHELRHYLLAHAENGELVEISSIIGAL